MMDSKIRNLNESEVNQLLKWANNEGWNPGITDARLFWKLDPEGYLGIEVEDQVVGGGAIIKHNQRFGFMGLFIVAPDFRGQKLGTHLWFSRRDRLLERLEEHGTIGLDGVDAMVPFYEKGGFKQHTRHRRFELRETSIKAVPNSRIQTLASIDFEKIEELDRQCFPGVRSTHLKSWIEEPLHISLGITDGNSVSGFGVMRPCQTGWKIGPLFANDDSIANDLFVKFCSHAKGQPIYLDIPDNNPAAIQLCKYYRMGEVFGCERMYLGTVPQLADDKIFGITTLEVG